MGGKCMIIIETIFWLICAHAIADYALQTPEIGKFKNKRNKPTPPKGARFIPVWPAYLTAHALIHAGLTALVVGPLFGMVIGISHWIQDYMKCQIQYSPNLDQAIHFIILIIVAVLSHQQWM